MRDHEPHRFPDVRAAQAPTGPPTTGGSAASPPGWPSTWACRCCGSGWASLALVAFGGFGAVLYAGLWMFLPAQRHTDPALARAGRRHPPGQARRAPRAPAGRLRTAGRRRRDRDRRTPAGHAGHRPDASPSARCCSPAPAWRCCGGRPTRPSAQRWRDPSRRMGPLRADRRRWRLARLAADRGRADAADRGDRAVLAALRQPERGPQRGAGRGLRHRRARLHGRAVAAAALLGPQRGARGPGALGGARGRGRPPARLGAPDAGPDPALGRRPGHGLPAGPRPGARPAVVAVRRRRRGPGHAGRRPAGGRRRGGGRPRRPRRGGLRG